MSLSANTPKTRPLSPHLQIYKPQITSVLSILHRVTGVGLTFGLVVFVAWLASLANGLEAYADFLNYAHSIIGQVILIGLSFCFFYHFCNGIRHLAWDVGQGFEIAQVTRTGQIVVAISLLLTGLAWLNFYGVL